MEEFKNPELIILAKDEYYRPGKPNKGLTHSVIL